MAVLKINENERGHFLWILSTDLTDSHLKKSFFHQPQEKPKKKLFFCFHENPLKMMNSAFYLS